MVITTYSVLLNLGLLAGVALTLLQTRRAAQPVAHTVDIVLAAIIGAVIAGRLAYVALNAAYFADHLDEAWQFWRGGLSWHAALIGGAIGVGLIARRQATSATLWLDRLAPGVALGTIFGWLACWLAACAFGREVFPGDALFALAVDAPDVYGSWAPRLPAQLFGAGWSTLVFAVALKSRWRAAGMRFAFFVALYSAGAFFIGFSRADSNIAIGRLSVEQALDVSAATTAWVAVGVYRKQNAEGAEHVH